jgi:hypothetical protein
MGTLIWELEHHFTILNLIIHIHFTTFHIFRLSPQGNVVSKIVKAHLPVVLEFNIIKKTVSVGHTQEKPSKAIKLVGWNVLHEHSL